MLKRITLLFLALFFVPLLGMSPVLAQEEEKEKVVVHYFEDRLCPVCKKQKEFMLSIQDDYPEMELKIYSISETDKLHEIAKEYGVTDYGIMSPTTFIGENFFQFRDFTSTHEQMILDALEGEIVEHDCCIETIPIFDVEIDIRGFSLFAITAILGSLDGFNVCSLGALILILSIVIKMNSRKKTFLYGGLFIFASAVIYGILVFTWGRLFETLVGQLEFLRTIVGIAALIGGIYFMRDFFKFLKYGPACESGSVKMKNDATNRVLKAFNDPTTGTIFLITSIIFFAAVITMVELPCSVGLPIAFTGVLAENALPIGTYTFYVVLYLFFYMLIELIVFTGAVLTKKLWFAGSKLITGVTLIGALVLFYLAYYYLISF
jgi:thiol-disulfide isomerase/thioredoxin